MKVTKHAGLIRDTYFYVVEIEESDIDELKIRKYHSNLMKSFSIEIHLGLKEEVRNKLLDDTGAFKRLGKPPFSYHRSSSYPYDYRGCRNAECKEKKKLEAEDKARAYANNQELMSNIEKVGREEIMAKVYEYIVQLNEATMKSHVDMFSGDALLGWVDGLADLSPAQNEIVELGKQLREAKRKLKAERNAIALKCLNDDNWKGWDDKGQVPEKLKEKLSKGLEAGTFFSTGLF